MDYNDVDYVYNIFQNFKFFYFLLIVALLMACTTLNFSVKKKIKKNKNQWK